MIKLTLKNELITAIQPIPMEPGRKKALIAFLRGLAEPFSPKAVKDFITLLDLNQAIQGMNVPQNETKQSWQQLIALYNKLPKSPSLTYLVPYCEELINYHEQQETNLTLQTRSQRQH